MDFPEHGDTVCSYLGLNFGNWNTSQMYLWANEYLQSRPDGGEEFWIGMKKAHRFTSFGGRRCPLVTIINGASLESNLIWFSNNTVSPHLYTDELDIQFDFCDENNIALQFHAGIPIIRDHSPSRKKFLCAKEESEDRLFLLLL